MKDSPSVNAVQSHIMHQLFTHEKLRFSEINTENVPSDQFAYHLRQLLKYALIEKTSDNFYSLTTSGKTRAILLDHQLSKIIRQGFVACRLIVSRVENGQTQYLMQTRTRVPFLGFIGEPGGKILFGEDVLAAAARNLLAETGLSGQLSLCGLTHFKDIYREEVVQDKFFFVVRARNAMGELLAQGPTGQNQWMTLAEIDQQPKVYSGVREMIAFAEGEGLQFLEEDHVVGEY